MSTTATQPHPNSKRDRSRFTISHTLRPWEEVTALWNERSGETLTRSRVWQIGREAEAKIRKLLQEGGIQ